MSRNGKVLQKEGVSVKQITIYVLLDNRGYFKSVYGTKKDAEYFKDAFYSDLTIVERTILLDEEPADSEKKEVIKRYERVIARLNGHIDGLEFALRCNGISGADILPEKRTQYCNYSR